MDRCGASLSGSASSLRRDQRLKKFYRLAHSSSSPARGAAAQRLRVGAVALAAPLRMLDMVPATKASTAVEDGIRHRHRLDQIVAGLGIPSPSNGSAVTARSRRAVRIPLAAAPPKAIAPAARLFAVMRFVSVVWNSMTAGPGIERGATAIVPRNTQFPGAASGLSGNTAAGCQMKSVHGLVALCALHHDTHRNADQRAHATVSRCLIGRPVIRFWGSMRSILSLSIAKMRTPAHPSPCRAPRRDQEASAIDPDHALQTRFVELLAVPQRVADCRRHRYRGRCPGQRGRRALQ